MIRLIATVTILAATACASSDATPLKAVHASCATRAAKAPRAAGQPSQHLVDLAKEVAAFRADVDRTMGKAAPAKLHSVASDVRAAVHASAAKAL